MSSSETPRSDAISAFPIRPAPVRFAEATINRPEMRPSWRNIFGWKLPETFLLER